MPMSDICKISDGDFFTQTLRVGEITSHSWEYCRQLCVGKKVLHVGCSDYPIFNAQTNMHLYLSKYTSELIGCDTNGIDLMKQHYCGKYYDSIDEVVDAKECFDVILVPNILEHLQNVGLMINALFKIKFKTLFVLVPNYSIYTQSKYENGFFTERIHPDHFAWYSPFTLWNLFQKYTDDCELNFFDNQNMISITINK